MKVLERPVPAPEAAAPPPVARAEAFDAPLHIPRSRLLAGAALAALAVAWMLGGIFEGSLARVLGGAGVLIGVATIGLAARYSRAAWTEYLLIPAAFVAAAVASIALPNATGSTGTVPELVARAIRNGGLLQPPVPFDPGWRFLVVFLTVLAAGALASVALSARRPLIVPAVPIPLVLGAGLLQPKGSELTSGVVSLVAIVGAMMVLYTAQVAGEASGGRRFELRQVARGFAALLAICVGVVALSRVDALFPQTETFPKPRPQKPKIVPLSAVPDRVLFHVDSELEGPWRLGVLDEYAGGSWLLPPVDRGRLVEPGSPPSLEGIDPRARTVVARFTVQGLEGLTLPSLPNPLGASAATIRVDDRTQVLRVTGSSPGRGYTYTVTGARPPTGEQLARAVGQPSEDLALFTQVPPPPPEIAALLRRAPQNAWERLQFVRARLYAKVVAAGSGLPIPVSQARVVAMLGGADASPFEITAAEALLARWAGIPARIGYGFYRGEDVAGGWDVRPKHGANWLEVWFPQRGWVPVIGVPPRARASLTSLEKNTQPLVRPADELTLQVYIPLEQQNPLLLYLVIRYWLAIVAPFVGAIALVWIFLPALVKPIRSVRRRRWGERRGARERIAVAYAEFRDAANDLNAGDPYDTPLEFVERIASDDEHLELAWLVTRALWGDLARGLAPDDAEAAERMSRSLRRRLPRAQTSLTRVLALSSRASLRGPFDPALPNPWPRSRGAVRRLVRRAIPRRRARARGATA